MYSTQIFFEKNYSNSPIVFFYVPKILVQQNLNCSKSVVTRTVVQPLEHNKTLLVNNCRSFSETICVLYIQ